MLPSIPALPPCRTANERGFLAGVAAKLIGFAVLGAIAIAGGVYAIIQLTGDTGANTIASRVCSDAEIFDLDLYGNRLAGGTREFRGALGCVPVCVWHNDDDLLLEPDELQFHRQLANAVLIDTSGVIAPNASYLFRSSNSTYGPAGVEVALDSISEAVPRYKVQADSGQNQCRLIDAQGEPVPPGTAIELAARVVAPVDGSTGDAPGEEPGEEPGDAPDNTSGDEPRSPLDRILDGPPDSATSTPPAEQ